jgi:glycine dehydrogenase
MGFLSRHIGIKPSTLSRIYKQLKVNPNSFLQKVIPPSIVRSLPPILPVNEYDALKNLKILMNSNNDYINYNYHQNNDRNGKDNHTDINYINQIDNIVINNVNKIGNTGDTGNIGNTGDTGNMGNMGDRGDTGDNNQYRNKDTHYMLGLDYQESILPNVISRNLLENPKWYTAYTPYQAEISQGRLESLFNYQTLISELTGLPISNSSLLDTGSASTEALNLAYYYHKEKRHTFFCSDTVHPHIVEILKTRCKILGIHFIVDTISNVDINQDLFGFYFSYPDTFGNIEYPIELIQKLKDNKTLVISQNDVMSLLLLKSPGELGVDISLGSTQRFGLPLWYGGPHSAFFATDSKYLRYVPGRIIGESIDKNGNKAYRMALQTREQHIKKEKAISNICTAQALLANTSSMYAIYHGKTGLVNIAENIYQQTQKLLNILKKLGYRVNQYATFDTIIIYLDDDEKHNIYKLLLSNGIETRLLDNGIQISVNETTTDSIIDKLIYLLLKYNTLNFNIDLYNIHTYEHNYKFDEDMRRDNNFLNQTIYKYPKSENEMLRYLHHLADKDYSLVSGMIPLGSCTMKLNSTTQMIPLSWDTLQNQHPFQINKPKGYQNMMNQLKDYLLTITGMDDISFQPNAGSMGEYTGLLCIKKYHETIGESDRNICLIPKSAHGTNFTSAKLAKLKILQYSDDLSLNQFRELVNTHKDKISCLMITYPNTYGIFDENIKEIIEIIHNAGGLVYMDGANMNAQCGITSPGECGADVCHLNLHKTFCIPHGGGGPGMGTIVVNKKLSPYLPSNIFQDENYSNNKDTIGMISSSDYSSASILAIPYLYLQMIGTSGLKKSTEIAILNANYLKKKLEKDYTIYRENQYGFVGHEFIIDLSEFKSLGITDKDVAKRLIDYSFHPPTMSWPIPNSIMIEPTESENIEELDRFIIAMKNIKREILEIKEGKYSKDNNVLVNAPHSQHDLINWSYPYSIEKGVFPVDNLKSQKQWPTHSRINDVYGDKNLKVKLSNYE